jgi:long-chain acyl-CoA synthetase
MREDTIPTLFLSRVKKYGDRVALRKKDLGIWDEISWNKYLENVKWVSLGLISLGLKRKEKVALIGENKPEWLYSDLGICCAGGVTIPIYSTSSSNQVGYILEHSDSRFFFVENEEQLDKILEVRVQTPKLEKIVVWDWEGLRHFSDPMVMKFDELMSVGRELEEKKPEIFETRLHEPQAEDIVTFVYTSGTTGPPKGAMISHKNAIQASNATAAVLPYYDTDNVLSYLPLCHIGERSVSVFHALNIGYTVNFAENLDTVPYNMREVRPEIFFAVPRIWEKYYSSIRIRVEEATWFQQKAYKAAESIGKKVARLKLSYKPIPIFLRLQYVLAHWLALRKIKEFLGLDRGRVIISGAAPVAKELLEYYHGLGLNIIELYGLTESTGGCTVHYPGRIKLGTIGQALPGIEIKLSDEGEILIRGETVFQGYFKDPELTAETIQDGWLYSGDIGTMDAEGFITITDRKKDIIITSGGKNITPQYIENQLKFSPYINDAVVIGDRRKYLTALIMIDEDNVLNYAQKHKVPFTTYADLSQKPEVTDLIRGEVEKVNKNLHHVEQLKKFRILDKQLDEDDDELTPTLKLKRKKISENFSYLIEQMYKSR